MESWYFTPRVGISSSIGQINFGDSSEYIKNILGSTCVNMTKNAGGTGCWLRLHYQNDNLVYIVFCNGSLIFDDVEILRTTKPQLKKHLKRKGFKIEKPKILIWDSCPDIYVMFASSKDVGGETNEISSIGMYCDEYLNFLINLSLR